MFCLVDNLGKYFILFCLVCYAALGIAGIHTENVPRLLYIHLHNKHCLLLVGIGLGLWSDYFAHAHLISRWIHAHVYVLLCTSRFFGD